MFRLAVVIFILLAPGNAIGQEIVGHGADPWYKIIAGIIAIPAAALGVLVSWNMMRKTRLETQKLAIEIAEKQKAISSQSSPAEKLELLALPLSNSQLALLIIIRFVLLDITLRLWSFVPWVISQTGAVVLYGFLLFFGIEKFPQGQTMIVMSAAPAFVNAILDVVRWVIIFGFGWPLFKDTCTFLNIPIKGLFDVPRIGWAKTNPT